ncbi:MAG: hypothetical protein HDR79_07445 [Bacteroides sp.]|nr:hypothetical protein [Bacteroides sp.]
MIKKLIFQAILVVNVIILSGFAPYGSTDNSLAMAKSELERFRQQASNGMNAAAYQTAYNAAQSFIDAVKGLRTNDSGFQECKQGLKELFPKLGEGAYFYASQNNQEEVLKFACAYVDVSILPCMSSEPLKNSHTYGTLANLAATNLYNRRQYDRSISYFQAYLESNEPSARENAFEGLARCYFEQKQYAMAASIASQGSKFFPGNMNLLLIGIESAGYNGNDPEMEQMLTLALRLQPAHRGLLEYQGKLYERMKRYEDAAVSFNRIVQTSGPTLDVLTHLGFNLYNAGTLNYIRARKSGDQTEMARAKELYMAAAPHLQQVLSNIPTAANVARALAFCYSANNDGTRLQEANRTLKNLNVATIDFNALPTLQNNYAPSAIIEQNSAATAQIAQTGQEEITSDVDIDIPSTGIKNDKLLVLIIANEKYRQVAPVDFARRDGEVFRKYCEKTLGADPDHIFCVYDASFSEMAQEIGRIKDLVNLDHDFNVIFYYAGHGMPDLDNNNQTSYLLPSDGDGRNFQYMISLEKLYEDFDAMHAKSVTVFLDACFSGNTRGGQPLYSGRFVAYDQAEQEAKGNTVVFSAGNGKQVANPYKEKGHGFFTYHLLKALKESRGEISLAELDQRIAHNVAFDVKSKLRADQTPTTKAAPALGTSWHTRRLIDK